MARVAVPSLPGSSVSPPLLTTSTKSASGSSWCSTTMSRSPLGRSRVTTGGSDNALGAPSTGGLRQVYRRRPATVCARDAEVVVDACESTRRRTTTSAVPARRSRAVISDGPGDDRSTDHWITPVTIRSRLPSGTTVSITRGLPRYVRRDALDIGERHLVVARGVLSRVVRRSDEVVVEVELIGLAEHAGDTIEELRARRVLCARQLAFCRALGHRASGSPRSRASPSRPASARASASR